MESEKWVEVAGYPQFEMDEEGNVRSKVTRKEYGKWENVHPKERA